MLLRLFDLLAIITFISTIPVLVFLQYNFNYYWDFIENKYFANDETAELYDFIVVGGGSAGSVVASRLSKNNKVLLIEAGGDPPYPHSIPALAIDLVGYEGTDWLYKTVPQKHAHQGMNDKRGNWPRGKVLGGSSVLNYMMYIRGSPHDYDSWANETGDDSWDYEHVLKYFKRSINYQGKFQADEKNYGFNSNPYGMQTVEVQPWGPLHEHFVDAAKELGFSEIDLTGPQRTGVGHHEVTQKQGKRADTFTAFLKDIQHRKTLKISRYSQAIKIKLDKNNRAVGVWYLKHGVKKFARASKEVILSAGAIDSPKLLLLSGIGPKSHLTEKGIKVHADLPVGQNLQDHLLSLVIPFTIDKPISLIPERDFGVSTFLEYFLHGKGPLTCASAAHSHLFFCSSISDCKSTGKDWPDIQLFISSAGNFENLAGDLSRFANINVEEFKAHLKPYVGKDGLFFAPILVRPKSVGQITLHDKNPLSKPLLDPKYLEHPDDVKVLIEGIKMGFKMVEETKSFKQLNAVYSANPYPGCEKFTFKSDQYFECYVRKIATTVFHPAGTCRMGKENDPKAVTDSKLRVLKTIGNLRVADASIMINVVSGNTNAPTIMIGEKAADMIREYWSTQFLVCDSKERLLNSNSNHCFYSKIP